MSSTNKKYRCIIYSGVKKECDYVQNFIATKLNQKYKKTYPKKIHNTPLRREKSDISSDNLFLQQLAVIAEELSRKVSLCTQPEFFRFLHVHNSKVLLGSPDVFYRRFSLGYSTNFR